MDSANDMKAAIATYNSFIANLKWTVPLIAIITACIVFAIAN